MNTVLPREVAAASPSAGKKLLKSIAQSRVIRWAFVGLLKACFGFKIHGAEFAPPQRTVVFAGNHGSHFDGIFSVAMSWLVQRQPAVVVAWGGTRDYPLAKPLIAAGALDLILVDENPSAESQAGVLAEMIDLLEAERSIVLHAEGGRRDRLSEFMPGAALAARAAGVPIVPFTLRGVQPLWKTLPMPDRWHGTVSVHLHPPVEPADYSHLPFRAAVAAMTAEVRRRVAAAIDYPDDLADPRESRVSSA